MNPRALLLIEYLDDAAWNSFKLLRVHYSSTIKMFQSKRFYGHQQHIKIDRGKTLIILDFRSRYICRELIKQKLCFLIAVVALWYAVDYDIVSFWLILLWPLIGVRAYVTLSSINVKSINEFLFTV